MWSIRILIFFLCLSANGQFIINSYAFAGGNVFDGLNAADPENEVNGTANTDGNSNHTYSSVTTLDSQVPTDGTYYLAIESTVTGVSESFITLPGVNNGDSVTIVLDANEITGLAWAIRLIAGQGWVADMNPGFTSAGDTWTEVTLTGTANADDPVISIRTTSSGAIGHQLGIDNIVVTKN